MIERQNDQETENTPSSCPTAPCIGYHPVADLFPLMDKRTFQELCDDIKVQGQLAPIWLHDGLIVDGRNRYRACLEVGVEPQFRSWDQRGTLVDFVLSLNLKRRHLTCAQRAVVAFRLLPMLESAAKARQIRKPADSVPEILPEQKTDARDQAAAMTGVCGKYVSDIKRIAKEAPEKMTALEAGTLTIQGAKRQIARDKAPQGEGTPALVEPTAMQLATDAIGQLSRIDGDDPQFLGAMDRIRDYVDNRVGCMLGKAPKIKILSGLSDEEQMFLFTEHELGR